MINMFMMKEAAASCQIEGIGTQYTTEELIELTFLYELYISSYKGKKENLDKNWSKYAKKWIDHRRAENTPKSLP